MRNVYTVYIYISRCKVWYTHIPYRYLKELEVELVVKLSCKGPDSVVFMALWPSLKTGAAGARRILLFLLWCHWVMNHISTWWWLEHDWLIFPYDLGMSTSQWTHIFQRGWNHQAVYVMNHICMFEHYTYRNYFIWFAPCI